MAKPDQLELKPGMKAVVKTRFTPHGYPTAEKAREATERGKIVAEFAGGYQVITGRQGEQRVLRYDGGQEDTITVAPNVNAFCNRLSKEQIEVLKKRHGG